MMEEEQPEESGRVEEPDFNYAGEYSYADYLRWTIGQRLELIRGKIFKMSAPGRVHQEKSGMLFLSLGNFLWKKACRVFAAPFDVRFPRKSKRDEDIVTVLQPDLCVICDPEKLDDKGCIGAPDIVVEILSKSNTEKELRKKYEVYEESGVREYWIVSPENHYFLIYTLQKDGRYLASRPQTKGDTVTTAVLPGFELDLEEFFAGIE